MQGFGERGRRAGRSRPVPVVYAIIVVVMWMAVKGTAACFHVRVDDAERWFQRGLELAGVDDAGAVPLLRAAAARDVPGARNLLGVTLRVLGELDEAERFLRAAVAAGDAYAPVNLAALLHAKGADAEAFALLRRAAERGDGPAYWIVIRLLSRSGRAARGVIREVTAAYESATRPEDRPLCLLVRAEDWRLDPTVLPLG